MDILRLFFCTGFRSEDECFVHPLTPSLCILRERIESPMNIVYGFRNTTMAKYISRKITKVLYTDYCWSLDTIHRWDVCRSCCVSRFVLFPFTLSGSIDPHTSRQIIRYVRKHRFSALDRVQYVLVRFVSVYFFFSFQYLIF